MKQSNNSSQVPTLQGSFVASSLRGVRRPTVPPGLSLVGGSLGRGTMTKQEVVAIIEEALRLTSFDDDDEDTFALFHNQ